MQGCRLCNTRAAHVDSRTAVSAARFYFFGGTYIHQQYSSSTAVVIITQSILLLGPSILLVYNRLCAILVSPELSALPSVGGAVAVAWVGGGGGGAVQAAAGSYFALSDGGHHELYAICQVY